MAKSMDVYLHVKLPCCRSTEMTVMRAARVSRDVLVGWYLQPGAGDVAAELVCL